MLEKLIVKNYKELQTAETGNADYDISRCALADRIKYLILPTDIKGQLFFKYNSIITSCFIRNVTSLDRANYCD